MSCDCHAVCSLLPGKRLTLALVCVFVTFPCGILGQVWYLIESIPDLCHLSYFHITMWVPYYIIIDKLTASYSGPFKICGYVSGYRQTSATTPFDGTP